ncbi:Nucleotide-binding universal stress protein, UspA family [Actinomadura meyerae]|jgi:nucleotide-binding universal stress UspA family protein|uniref:Nucleotide-binding universal stress protein, UspA family n=1 Tax=Actinomadura meyerae TaxID=240840 RepID=A0A239HJG8_9ACTN|nr:universal stress protein [Actinomadura meyerae]SNS80414.1 Nucleotide-binding universal stress protein, UspA family [Actinomadura meyerae]
MPAPITVGTDGSDESARALDWAASEAALRDRPLHIVHVVESWPYRTARSARAETAELLTRAGRRILADARERVRERWPDLATTTALVSGETWQVLGAQSEKAFELVLGGRGRGGYAGSLLGSTSLRMAELSTVPVVVVRGDTAGGGEILAGIDPVRDAGAILDYAFGSAALHRVRLRLVHAWQSLALFLEAGYSDVEHIEADLRRDVVTAYRPLRDRYPDVDVVEEIVLEHPVTALAKASREAHLLVVGARDWHWSSPQLGSVQHGVLHHAQCPVAVVPAR